MFDIRTVCVCVRCECLILHLNSVCAHSSSLFITSLVIYQDAHDCSGILRSNDDGAEEEGCEGRDAHFCSLAMWVVCTNLPCVTSVYTAREIVALYKTSSSLLEA